MSPAQPLTAEELKWLRTLQKHLDKCPSGRLASYTTGDNSLFFYDRLVRDEWVAQHESRRVDLEIDELTLIPKAGADLDFVLQFPFQVAGLVG